MPATLLWKIDSLLRRRLRSLSCEELRCGRALVLFWGPVWEGLLILSTRLREFLTGRFLRSRDLLRSATLDRW